MLIVYGVPNSQPVRAVVWPCLMKGLPFELRMTSQDRDAKTPRFLAEVNPRGTVPAIDDDGVVLWESHAILVYLCEKHGWTDLWPADPVHRARVNQYLHFHHRNTRELVVTWSRSLWPAVLGMEAPDAAWLRAHTFAGLEDTAEVQRRTLEILDTQLARSQFVASGPGPTIADVSAYEEIGQNQPKYANCLDYAPYPGIRRWLADMERLPHHDAAHRIWALVGDVRRFRGGMRALAAANKAAARVIREAAGRTAAPGPR